MNIKQIVKLLQHLLTSGTQESKNSSESQPSPSLEAKVPEIIKPSLRQDEENYIWKKGEKFKLTPHFSTAEFVCHCNYEDCVDQKISKELVTKLEQIRNEVAQPLIISSAYRCSKHQNKLREDGVNTVVAQKISQHELGKAVDAVPKDRKNVLGSFLTICEKHFTAIGTSEQFLHLDLRKQYIRWKY